MRCGVVKITVHAHPSKLLSKGPGTPLSGTYTHIHTQGHEEIDVRWMHVHSVKCVFTHTARRLKNMCELRQIHEHT